MISKNGHSTDWAQAIKLLKLISGTIVDAGLVFDTIYLELSNGK